jgi:hypothetical protein
VLWNDIITSATNGSDRSVRRTGSWEINVTCLLFQTRPPRSDRVLFVLYDFETTRNTKCTDNSFEHVPKLAFVQQFCAVCEDDADVEVDCRRCGKRSAVSQQILSAISFPTRLHPDRGPIGSWPLSIMPLRTLPEVFGLTAVKSWYTHLFHMAENMNYVGSAQDVSYDDVE